MTRERGAGRRRQMQNGRRPSDRSAGLSSGRSSSHLSVRVPAVCFPISKPNPGPPTARQLGTPRGPVAKRSGRHVRKATFRVVDRRAVGENPDDIGPPPDLLVEFPGDFGPALPPDQSQLHAWVRRTFLPDRQPEGGQWAAPSDLACAGASVTDIGDDRLQSFRQANPVGRNRLPEQHLYHRSGNDLVVRLGAAE